MTPALDTVVNVDDNEPTRYARTRVLQRAGFQVIETGSGEEALRLVADRRPGIVILDVNLPDLNGIEVCRRIKRDHPSTLVLHISASHTATTDRVHGLDAGGDVYLAEPIEPEELVASVRALMRLRQAEDQLRVLAERLEERVADRTRELAEANERLRIEIEERERAEAQLRQALKMEAIGHLTGGIAHDFNNLLTVILGGVERARRHVTEPSAQRMLSNAAQAGLQAARLTAQLLSFARKQHFVRQSLSLRALLQRLHSFLQQTIGPLHRVELDVEENDWPVLTDASQIESLLLNLVINARDAMPEGGTVTISVANFPPDAPRRPAGLDGELVLLRVSDTGVGMSPDVQARAFEPFFTTKGVGRGTGLGLSMVYGVAKQSGGDVTIDSVVGRGTAINVFLPRGPGEQADTPKTPRPRIAPGARDGFTILLVDDDDPVLEYTSATLRDLGFTVIVAPDGSSAIARVAEDVPIDLLIVDFAMPGMSGADVVRRARELRPNLPVLFMTGFADNAVLEDLARNHTILKKPFGRMDIDSAVAAAVGRLLA
ncbi:MAG: response regulator [Alphaproteobacteria bacterium]